LRAVAVSSQLCLKLEQVLVVAQNQSIGISALEALVEFHENVIDQLLQLWSTWGSMKELADTNTRTIDCNWKVMIRTHGLQIHHRLPNLTTLLLNKTIFPGSATTTLTSSRKHHLLIIFTSNNFQHEFFHSNFSDIVVFKYLLYKATHSTLRLPTQKGYCHFTSSRNHLVASSASS
jgi:hypothetical protein